MNPYLITGPALVSFSGGRTSAYMLRMMLDANGGRLPDDVHVVFANTGRERPETLDFVQSCSAHWGVRVVWVERRMDLPEGFEEVSHNSACRDGVVFQRIIESRKFLPNAVARFCTSELKVKATRHWMRAQGYGRYLNVIGLRHDEQRRVTKQHKRNLSSKEVFKTTMPLDLAKVTKAQVNDWWAAQPFDLGLPNNSDSFGNCDVCFLKSRARRIEVLLHDLSAADWWINAEDRVTDIGAKATGARFCKSGPTYRQLRDYVRDYPHRARAEVESYKEGLRIAAGAGDLFDGESVDCACTD